MENSSYTKYHKKYYNSPKSDATRKSWREKNKDKINGWVKKWRMKNPTKNKIYYLNSKLKKLTSGCVYDKSLAEQIRSKIEQLKSL